MPRMRLLTWEEQAAFGARAAFLATEARRLRVPAWHMREAMIAAFDRKVEELEHNEGAKSDG